MTKSALLGLLLALSPASAADDKPLNVLVVDICSARADRFGLYGNKKDTTPNLDALAKESAVFDHAIAQGSWCLPNYASLFTGHTPEVHGQYTNVPFRPLPKFETTVAEKLKEAGYKTASFSGGIYFLPAWGLARGFDTYVNLFSTGSAMPASFSQSLPQITDWIKKNQKKPFFLYAAVDDLHAPYQSEDPDKYDAGYEGIVHDTETANVRFFRVYNGEKLEKSEGLMKKLEEFKKDPKHLKHLAAHYDAALSSVDQKVSELFKRLKGMGLWDNTVVIVTADHGELLGEHGLLGHTEGLYEGALKVPLIIHHPKHPELAGKRLQQLVERVDLTPTILDVGRVDYSDLELQGKSLIPVLEDPSLELRGYAYASSKRNMAKVTDLLIDERVIRNRKWKLHWYLYKDKYELYDIEKDPLETKDVAKLYPEVVSELSFELMKRVELGRPHAPGMPSGKSSLSQPPKLDLMIDTH